MSDYFKARKAELPKDIATKRSEFVVNIMNGLTAKEAFDRFHK